MRYPRPLQQGRPGADNPAPARLVLLLRASAPVWEASTNLTSSEECKAQVGMPGQKRLMFLPWHFI